MEGAGVTDGQERDQGERQPLPSATGRHASDGEEGEGNAGEGGEGRDMREGKGGT